MSRIQAFEAIHLTAPALVDKQLSERIVNYVAAAEEEASGSTREIPGAELTVDPALLSLVCQGLNKKRKAQGKAKFDAELLEGGKRSIISDYYQTAIADMPDHVERFIENQLITERGFRKPCDRYDAHKIHGITDGQLSALVDRRLLRIESQRGTERVELTHDLLTSVIREHRDQERERQKWRRLFFISGIGALLVVLVITFGWLWLTTKKALRTAEIQRQVAQVARDEAENQKQVAQEQRAELKRRSMALREQATKLWTQTVSLTAQKRRADTKATEAGKERRRADISEWRAKLAEARPKELDLDRRKNILSQELASLEDQLQKAPSEQRASLRAEIDKKKQDLEGFESDAASIRSTVSNAVTQLAKTSSPEVQLKFKKIGKIDTEKVFESFRDMEGPLSQGQVDGLNFLINSINHDFDISDLRWAAYILATIYLQTAHTFRPIEEIGKGRGRPYGAADPVTGQAYYGRGYLPLTWKRNYDTFTRALGLRDDLVNHPDDALNPEIAYRVVSVGMRRGLFSGKRLDDYIHGDVCDYVNARRIINALDRADLIAGYAQKWEAILKGSLSPR